MLSVDVTPLYPYRNHGIPDFVSSSTEEDGEPIVNHMPNRSQEVGLQVGNSHILFNTPPDILYHVLFRRDLYIDANLDTRLNDYIKTYNEHCETANAKQRPLTVGVHNTLGSQVLPIDVQRRDGQTLSPRDLYEPWQHTVKLFFLDYAQQTPTKKERGVMDYYTFYTPLYNIVGLSASTNLIYFHPYIPLSDDEWLAAQTKRVKNPQDDNTRTSFVTRNPRYQHALSDIDSNVDNMDNQIRIDDVLHYSRIKAITPASLIPHTLGFTEYQLGINRQ